MPVFLFLLLLVFFLISGYGVLLLFGLRFRPAYTITLSLMLGVVVASLVPFVLQLFYIKLTGATIFGSLVLTALLLCIPVWRLVRREGFGVVRNSFIPARFRIQPYEIPFWMIIGFMVFVSVWRCYYLPPTSRDMLSGPEAIADVAVREHTMINSFFNVDLWSTNNQYKSPYLISLQLIYKLAGFPFGQIWLSVLFISFTVFLYQALREKVHPLLAGLLLLIFTMSPEMYAYTFMILYDYSNMVFLFLGLYYLFESFTSSGRDSTTRFYFAGLLVGIATYIRSETVVLALLFLPPIVLSQRRAAYSVKRIVIVDVLFFLPSFLGYFLTTTIWIKYYLPGHYDVDSLFNSHLGDLSPLFQRYSDIVTHLLAGDLGIRLWGYIFYITAFLFVAQAIFVRRFNRDARNWLYALGIIYLGLGAMGWLLPLMNLNETTKRALFKLLPLALLYLANNELLLRLSAWIVKWEEKPWGVSSSSAPKPALATPKTVLTKSGKAVSAAAAPAKGDTVKPSGGGTSPRKKRKR